MSLGHFHCRVCIISIAPWDLGCGRSNTRQFINRIIELISLRRLKRGSWYQRQQAAQILCIYYIPMYEAGWAKSHIVSR